LEREGSRVEIHRRKVLALLIYLAVTGRSHSRDSLAVLFWPEQSQTSARAALRRTLSEVLKILGEKLILVEQDTIQLKTHADFWLDIQEFHTQLNAYRLHGHHPGDPCPDCLVGLGEAITLYQDEFVAGFTLGDSPEFDEWQILQAEVNHREMIGALSRLVLGHAANGEIEAATGFAHRWLALDALDEVAHRHLMQLYAWSGKRSEALRQYQECARILKGELGVSPAKETTALYDHIRSQEETRAPRGIPSPGPAALPRRPNNLPAQLTSFIGRAEELAAMEQEISRPDVHLLTLTGPAGVGKTRLGIEVAAQIIEKFEDGAFFVPLAPLSDPGLVIQTIAHVLGVRESKNMPLLETLKAYVRDRQMLLVLDNFEHLIKAAPFVTELLTTAPRLKILVTSRTLLHVYGEHLHPVLPMKTTRTGEGAILNLDRATQPEAVKLFIERAQAVSADFILTPESYQTLVEICARLDGLPLAIELAAARARNLPPRSMLEQWAGDSGRTPLQTLIDGPRDRPDRHKTLRNAIAWSYNLLELEDQIAFRRAGVFVGGWTLEAAENVIQAPLIEDEKLGQSPRVSIASALESLADNHLLDRDDRAGGKRYTMLETVREYALEQLETCHEVEAVQDIHARYYLAFAETARQNLLGPEQSSWVNRLAQEYDNLRAALKWVVSHQKAEMALRLVGALGRFWYLYDSNYWNEARSWIKRALNLPASETAPLDFQAKALNESGVLAWVQADYEQAIHSFEACLALKKKVGDKAGIGSALGNLGLVAREQLDLPRARAYHEDSLAIKRELGDKQGIATALGNLGLAVADMGEWGSAAALFEESIHLNRELQNKSGLTLTLHNLGGLLVENQVDYFRARALLEESLELSRELGKNFFLIPYTLGHLGKLALYQNNYEQARMFLEQSLFLSRESNNLFGIGHVLHGLGSLHYRLGDNDHAQKCFIQSIQALNEVHGWVGVVWDFISMAGLACRWGNPARAITLLGASESLREKIHIALHSARADEYQSNLEIARSQLTEADFNRSFGQGRAMSVDTAVAYAIG
jgi:predicted ATPase/DNA-binding SARP family transcriptional activator